jgi:predicted TIM-barrel fold metal-dependent hydrolase
VSGETASLTNPALDRILDVAAESGLVVILHNDIDVPFAKENAEPAYLSQMKALLKRYRNASIIWAHVGLGRIVHPVRRAWEKTHVK